MRERQAGRFAPSVLGIWSMIMQIPNFTLVPSPADAEGVLVLPILAGDTPQILAADDYGLTAERLAALDFTGKAGGTARILVANGEERAALLVGIGKERTLEALRRAAGSAARALKREAHVVIELSDATAEELEALALGFALGAHQLDIYKKADEERPEERSVALVSTEDAAQEALDRARILAEAVVFARDLGNTPPNELVPEEFARRSTDVTAELPIEVAVWDEAKLADEDCGGILGVGQGSANPPRLVHLSYAPEGAATHVALVGKGITFDTGGISIKPAGSMLGMKFDMSGAGSVLATIVAVAKLGLPVRVSGYCCLAENMPSADALKPDDVLRMRGGTTVEVTNTDAEGRLVLADGLVLASEAQPDVVIDIATLTGAQVVALGNRTTGLMGNNDEWRDRLVAAGQRTGEVVWPMPIPEEIAERLESPVADLVNAKPGDRSAGMLFAAAFLERFIGKDAEGEPIAWAHLDIAGPAENGGGAYGYTPKGATGVPVRTLVETIAALS